MSKKILISLIVLLVILVSIVGIFYRQQKILTNLSNLTKDQGDSKQDYRPGVLIVKFTAAAYNSPNFKIIIGNDGIAKTGIASLDYLNAEVGAINITKEGLHEPQNKELARDLGIDRTFIIKVSQDANIIDIAEMYQKDQNIEYAGPDWVMKLAN